MTVTCMSGNYKEGKGWNKRETIDKKGGNCIRGLTAPLDVQKDERREKSADEGTSRQNTILSG